MTTAALGAPHPQRRTEPNVEQSAAIEFGSGALRIMAGAGAGKTYTLAHSIVSLVQRGIAAPGQILALTFTIKAAEELRTRINRTVAEQTGSAEMVDVDTYNAFGGRIVAEHGHLIGLPPDPLLLTPAEGWILLWRCMDRIDFQSIDLQHLRGGPQGSPLSKMIGFGSRLHDELRGLDEAEALLRVDEDHGNPDLGDYVRALRAYEQAKRQRGAIDFGDQIALACDLLRRPQVRNAYAERYRVVLVDEFQDTNYAQSAMVQALANAVGGNIRVVGDPNQAIYAFRGAAPDNLDRFQREEFPEAATIELRQNYRSTQSILALANAIWDDDRGPYRGNLVAASGEVGVRPRLVSCDAFADECAWIGTQIQRMVGGGRQYRDIAILVRKNSLKRSIWRALRDQRIPIEAVGGTSLYETLEVRLLISALRVIGDPNDDASLAHLLGADRWGIDEKALHRLATARSRGERLLSAARRVLQSVQDGELIELRECVEAIDRLVFRSYRVSLPRLLDDVIELVGGAFDTLERANASQFRAVVQDFASSRVDTPTLADLLGYLDLLLDAGPDDAATSEFDLGDADTVKIMTSHAAKGLEWPVVFVAGVNENDLTIRKQDRKPDLLPPVLARPVPGRPLRSEYEPGPAGAAAFLAANKEWAVHQQDLEERRVLYVALTRAQRELVLTWSATTPARKRPTRLHPWIAAVADQYDEVHAPAAQRDGRSLVGDFAAETLPAATTLLRGVEARPSLLQTMSPQWTSLGGDLEALAEGIAIFERERPRLRSAIAVMHAAEASAQHALTGATNARGPVSYSQIETHRFCPHRYYLRHVVGLPGLPEETAASVGTAVHEAIALDATSRRMGRTIALAEARTRVGLDVGAATVSAGAVAGFDPLETYFSSVDRDCEPLLVEAPFTLRLGEIVINGVIDRVHRRPGGSIEVVDYKTDRRVRSEAEIRDGLQLQVYLIACREVFPEIQPGPSRAAMFFLRANVRVELIFTPADLDAARARIQHEATRLGDVTPTQHAATPDKCRVCEFRETCRFRMS
jgi:DNA helicase-2/ATP-dependent DNA helicase PcrA